MQQQVETGRPPKRNPRSGLLIVVVEGRVVSATMVVADQLIYVIAGQRDESFNQYRCSRATD